MAFGGTNPIPGSGLLAPVEREAQPADDGNDAGRILPGRYGESRHCGSCLERNHRLGPDDIPGALHRRMN